MVPSPIRRFGEKADAEFCKSVSANAFTPRVSGDSSVLEKWSGVATTWVEGMRWKVGEFLKLTEEVLLTEGFVSSEVLESTVFWPLNSSILSNWSIWEDCGVKSGLLRLVPPFSSSKKWEEWWEFFLRENNAITPAMKMSPPIQDTAIISPVVRALLLPPPPPEFLSMWRVPGGGEGALPLDHLFPPVLTKKLKKKKSMLLHLLIVFKREWEIKRLTQGFQCSSARLGSNQ